MLQTLALGQLLRYYASTNKEISKQEAYLYATAIALLSIFNMLILHNMFIRLHYLGIKLVVSTSSMIYQKSLKLSRNALNEYSAGNIVNLLSNDVNRFERGIAFTHYILLAPIIFAIFLLVMYVFVGLTACIGITSLFLYVALQSKFIFVQVDAMYKRQ